MTHPIVACARGWIGTRFHHQGRIKKTGSHKGGVDCLGLLAGVAAELDLRGADGLPLVRFDETDYAHQPDAKRLYARLAEVLVPITTSPSPCRGEGRGGGLQGKASEVFPCGESPFPLRQEASGDAALTLPPAGGGDSRTFPGDIVLLRIDESPQHLAIVSDGAEGLGLIHAYAPARGVVEHQLDAWWWERIEAVFRIPAE